MAYTLHRGKRVSLDHAIMLAAYEAAHGPIAINQGARTIAEQWKFWRIFQAGGNIAAFPSPAAPHIKFRRGNHAMDVNAPQPAQSLADFYRAHGVPVAFNVAGEPWHMDFTDRAALRRAAAKLKVHHAPVLRKGSRGRDVIRLKKLLSSAGIRNFSGKHNSNRFVPFFGKYTKLAVERFQRAHGLTPDGVVGSSTWTVLRRTTK